MKSRRRWSELGAGAVLLVLAGVALLPARTSGFDSEPAPARSYDDAVARVARRQENDDRTVAPGGRSLLMTHGARSPRVVVLFHGLTNSPKQYEHIAALLFSEGDNVYIPRIPHHAERNGTAHELGRLTAEELRACADSALDVAAGLGDSIIVAGVSAGGTISAWVAQNRPSVSRAVIVAPALEIARVPSFLAGPMMNLGLRVPNLTETEAPDSVRPDRELGVSTRAVAQVLRLGLAVRRAAEHTPPRVNEIVFVMNANDHTVKTAAAVSLAHRWITAGAHVTVYEFPRSLGLPHDVFEEAHPNANPRVVYPALVLLMHGQSPPAVLADHRLVP